MVGRRILFIAVLLFLRSSQLRTAEPDRAQWVAVTPAALRPALEPLCQERRREGFDVHVVTIDEMATDGKTALPGQIKSEIAKLRGDRPTYVLLFGSPGEGGNDSNAAVVPMSEGTVGRMKGKPTDHDYGLGGNNLAASIAVGRLPARNLAEARGMVDKTLAFARTKTQGDWQNRLTVLIGNPGGANEFERRMAEAVGPTAMMLRFSQIDPRLTARFLIHAGGSPYTMPDAELHERSLKYVEDGEFFTCFLGHSAAPGFWSGGARFLDRSDWSELNIKQGPGVFFTCGCFSCQIAGPDGEGYAFAAARNPQGPVAVIGSHGESYSVAGLLALDGLLGCWHGGEMPRRLADYWLAVQDGLARGPVDSLTFFALDQVDGSRGKSSLEEQRREHLEMWTLLGDPALCMPASAKVIQLECSRAIAPGQELTVNGQLPDAIKTANVRLTLERPLASPPTGIVAVPSDLKQMADAIRANHERANNLVLATQSVDAHNGRFTAAITVPKDVPWSKLIVRAVADVNDRSVRGVLAISISK